MDAETFSTIYGHVFRHKRLFNYVVIPLSIDEDEVKCHVGKESYKTFPIRTFERDWLPDTSLEYDILLEKIDAYPIETPFTEIYDSYEPDDGKPHSYIHFDDNIEEKMVRFPKWNLTTCTNSERKDRINPFTMIMPVTDDLESEIQEELTLMNDLRVDNEYVDTNVYQGFEFGLIKYLEKKYLRLI